MSGSAAGLLAGSRISLTLHPRYACCMALAHENPRGVAVTAQDDERRGVTRPNEGEDDMDHSLARRATSVRQVGQGSRAPIPLTTRARVLNPLIVIDIEHTVNERRPVPVTVF